MAMKKFLVAVDGSVHAKKAVDLAIDMAKKWGAEIILLHVREEMEVPEGVKQFMKIEKMGTSFGDYLEWVCRGDQFLGEAEARIRAAGGITVERFCVDGNPADEILRAAESHQVDMIIMGSRGLGRFSRALMGSVSTKVCNHANSTCVTVK